MTICEIENKALEQMEIGIESEAIVNSPAKQFYCTLTSGAYNEALFMLFRYMQDNFVLKTSIENKIGRKLLSFFKVKVYE